MMIRKIVLLGLLSLMILGCKTEPVKAAEVVSLLNEAPVEGLSLSDTLKKIPSLKQGVGYSLLDNDFSYLSTLEIANWKGLTLEAGYSSRDKIIGVISYEVLKLKDYVNLPILNLLEFNIGLYGGWGRLNIKALDKSEWDAGISATLLKIKW